MIRILFLTICLILCGSNSYAQSTNIEYPTPISSNEIQGKIAARDIGDARLTSHYYIFDGQQGDIFINIETNNLNGDIDIFIANGLRPLTKVSLFAESTPTQTGRELYLRKNERMILRIEGRSPNDDPATYNIKFSGSFVSIAKNAVKEQPNQPKVKNETETDVVVNSVGTIIETKVKETEPEKVAKTTKPKTTKPKTTKAKTANNGENSTPEPVSTIKPKKTTVAKTETKAVPKKEETQDKPNKPVVIVTENLAKTETKVENPETESKKKTPTVKKTTLPKKTTVAKNNKTATVEKTKSQQTEELTKALENVKLIVLFKDGGTVESAMNDVLRFGVDKGILTIVKKDGSIGRYSIIDITKISVE